MAAASDMIPPEQGALRPGIRFQDVTHRRNRADCLTHHCLVYESLSSKKTLNFAQHLDKSIDFLGRVVKVKAGARCGFHSQFAHQWLVAMMPPSQSNSSLVGHRHHIVRMDILQ